MIISDELRAPVQRDCPNHKPGVYCKHTADAPEHHAGTISWPEYLEAHAIYAKRHDQSAERIAKRGGWGYAEVTKLLGHPPTTWIRALDAQAADGGGV